MEREPGGGEKQFNIEERLAMIDAPDHELEHLTASPEQNAESVVSKTELRNKIAGELGELTGKGKKEVQELIAKHKENKG